MDVSDGHIVTIAYELTDGEGLEIERVDEEDGLSYLHGHGNIVPGLENALHGLSVGEEFETTVQPDQGYGEHAEELVSWVDREAFPGDAEPEPGMAFQASRSNAEGGTEQQILFVTDITEDEVKVDANHPLAGKVLHFEGKVLDVREPTDEELEAGRPLEEGA